MAKLPLEQHLDSLRDGTFLCRNDLLVFLMYRGACSPALSWVAGQPPAMSVSQIWYLATEIGWMLWLWTALDPAAAPNERAERHLPILRPGIGEDLRPMLKELDWEQMERWSYDQGDPVPAALRELDTWNDDEDISNGYGVDTGDLFIDDEAREKFIAPLLDHVRTHVTGEMLEEQLRTYMDRKRELEEE